MAHYEDYAEYYDYEQGGSLDLAFYRECAAAYGPRVLELACGTGRLLVPLAEEGVRIDGLDFSENMLSVCREKLAVRGLLDRTELFRCDMARFDLPCKDYDLIYVPYRSFMHLFDQPAKIGCLSCSWRHLRLGGCFIVDVYAPSFAALTQEPDAPFAVTTEYDLPSGRHVVRSDRFVSHDPVRQIQHCQRKFQEYAADGSLVRERTIPMDTRYTFRYELQLLLERAGFNVVNVFRDDEKTPSTARARSLWSHGKGRDQRRRSNALFEIPRVGQCLHRNPAGGIRRDAQPGCHSSDLSQKLRRRVRRDTGWAGGQPLLRFWPADIQPGRE